MSAIIYYQNPCKLPVSFRCIKAFMHVFSGRFSRASLEGISFNFFLFYLRCINRKCAKEKTHWYPTYYQSRCRMPVNFKSIVIASYVQCTCNRVYYQDKNFIGQSPYILVQQQKIEILPPRRGADNISWFFRQKDDLGLPKLPRQQFQRIWNRR